MLTAPDVEVSAPPDIVIPALAVSAFVPLARAPPERVSSPDVVSWLWRVRVPPLTVCVTLMEPPDAFTTTVEAPTVNVPRWVSIEVTVMMDPLAVRAPPAFTTSVAGLIARFEPLVFSVVVPAPPAIVSVPPTSRLFAAIVNVTVEAPELNVTFPANSRVGLPNVIVREAEELKVIGATKLHEADVEEFVHDPDAVQEPPAVDELLDI